MKIKIKIPGLGFMFIVLAIVFSIISLVFYINTYKIEPYTIDRWALMYTVLAMWCLVFLAVNMLFKGDKPVWCIVVYAGAVFMMIYALLRLLQPCINPIGYVFGSGDLMMGDFEKNRQIASSSITTAVFYVITAVFTIAAAFSPAEWTFGKKKKQAMMESDTAAEAVPAVAADAATVYPGTAEIGDGHGSADLRDDNSTGGFANNGEENDL